MPHLDTRLSMLLSITPLVVAELIKEEEISPTAKTEYKTGNNCKEKAPGERRRDLISCLQSLGDYQTLLTPPESVLSAANQAAATAVMFTAGINAGNVYSECTNRKNMPTSCCK